MKTTTHIAFLLLISVSGFSQNILEALQLKSEIIGAYVEGEIRSNDTIIDIKNGYYEQFLSSDNVKTTSLRQAALFKNQDSSTLLGISTEDYDFVCFIPKSNFYHIPVDKDTIITLNSQEILPNLSIREFIGGDSLYHLLDKYLPEAQEDYLGPKATLDDFLNEIYAIRLLQPRFGTTLIATLSVCDHIPYNEVTIDPKDWAFIEKSFGIIELEYDNKAKIFRKGSFINTNINGE